MDALSATRREKLNLAGVRHVHCIGAGGINMSAVAKLLQKLGYAVSGSDAAGNELTDELKKNAIAVSIGHAGENVPPETDLILYSSAVPENNPERAAGRKRGIVQLTNFEFLGEWSEDKKPILICGTHGKSTTTALVGLMFAEAGADPTVIVGSRVPAFPEGNIRFGQSEAVVIEGDEYERHFLEFRPFAVILNNIELDHTDVFPDIAAFTDAFRELLARVQDGGWVVANADDPHVGTLIGRERERLTARGIKIKTFGFGSHADIQILEHAPRAGEQAFALRDEHGLVSRFLLHVPGKMNVMNATAAIALATSLGVTPDAIRLTLGLFHGIWRRFERVAGDDKTDVISDYGHHPTAVAATLEAAKAWYPGRRIVLCFQPHHRNRTKQLFLDFVPSFDKADALVLAEIYDVAGRDAEADQGVSSRDLRDAVIHHDADRGANRPVEYAADPPEALKILQRWRAPGDVIIVMGAGDIYKIAKRVVE